MDYVGAFYPTEQVNGSESEWEACVHGLNLVLASYKNFRSSNGIPSFASNAVGFTNHFLSRVALMWDVNYAYRPLFTQPSAEANLKAGMDGLKSAIDDLGWSPAEKKDLWNQMNWGGLVADEPVANRANTAQNSDIAIEGKCTALKNVFNEYSGDWELGDPKILAVFHRQDNCAAWNTPTSGDEYFIGHAEDWKTYGINQWGMDTYIQTGDDDTKITNDRGWFFDALTDELAIEDEGTRFMVMVGRAFSQTKDPAPGHGEDECNNPAYPGWLNETRTWYYYDRARETSGGVVWRQQFSALLWWAYCTDALAYEYKQGENKDNYTCRIKNNGFDANSDVAQYVFDVGDWNS